MKHGRFGKAFGTFGIKSTFRTLRLWSLLHIHRKDRENSLNKWITPIEWVLDLFPGSMLLHDTCTMHLGEILRYLRWSTVRETSYLSGRESFDAKEKIDNLESAVWCKCTKYICHLSKEILFFPHFILYLCEIRHKKYRTTCCSWWEKFALFSLITLSFYEIIKWKQMFF